ncbi:MAG: hypothetical protein ABIA74_05300, partial [bacterium]
MNLKIGNSYMIILKINNTTLTYHCKIISEDEHFITFIDKYGKEFTYNKNLIIQIALMNNRGENG